MSLAFTLAQQIVALAGPGRYMALDGCDPCLLSELRLLGCEVVACDEPVPLAASSDGCDVVLAKSSWLLAGGVQGGLRVPHDLVPRHLFVLNAGDAVTGVSGPAVRALLTEAALRGGYRRALAECSSAFIDSLHDDSPWRFLMFDPIAGPAGAGAPGERAAGMDMSRAWGGRADARLAGYALAADRVRPGDLVLDVGCGAGEGSALLAARSMASRIIGVDRDPDCIDYATSHFAERYAIDFRTLGSAELGSFEDHSVDCVVMLGAPAGSDDPSTMLDELARVMKPDGRLIASATGPWCNATAWARHFLVEARHAQQMPVGCAQPDARRRLVRVPLDQAEVPDAERWIIVASARPDRRSARRYRHPEFASHAEGGVAPVDFGTYYDNPWIYRSIVQLGQRIENPALLTEACLAVLGASRISSPDFGAALCVLAYQVLSRRDHEQADNIRDIVDAYLEVCSENPHVRRWQVSLGFVAGLLCMMAGRRAEATGYFERVLRHEPIGFSSLLATKSIAACYWLGTLHLSAGDVERAREAYRRGVDEGRRALRAVDVASIGNVSDPLPFAFQELAEVADMASQCAKALHLMPVHARSPGSFWRQVDTRRFGLATWLLQLQKENETLRAVAAITP